MNTRITIPRLIPIKKSNEDQIIDLYNETIEDYQFWSKDCNMHLGYYIPFKTSFLKRDTMLNEMNNQVFNRLHFNKQNGTVLDLGCGMGGTMKYGLRKYPRLKIFGLTLSPFQVQEGNKRLHNMNGSILEENYLHSSFKSNSMDSVYAIESLCHSGHSEDALKEAYRLIKPGGKLVIADAFLKKNAEELCLGASFFYKELCNSWNLSGLGNIQEVKSTLEKIGFTNVVVENISFRVATSVLHVPFAVTSFVFKKLCKKEPMKKESRNNLKGSLFALLSGLHMKSFGYFLVTAEK